MVGVRACRSRRRLHAHRSRQSACGDRRDEHIAQAVLRLVEFPESGRPGRVPGTRELVIPRTPYVVAYALTGDRIRILRVLHGAQMWPDDLASD